MKRTDTANIAVASCPSCGNGRTIHKLETESFVYGAGDDKVTLTAIVPVFTCEACGTAFSTGEVEDIRHEAVCRHLGVLTPTEIKRIRTQYKLSRSEFARLTRIGEATLARWERGSLIQNAGYDQLLRLLGFPENLRRLDRSTGHTVPMATPIAQFRYLTRTPELEEARAAFQLQKGK